MPFQQDNCVRRSFGGPRALVVVDVFATTDDVGSFSGHSACLRHFDPLQGTMLTSTDYKPTMSIFCPFLQATILNAHMIPSNTTESQRAKVHEEYR